jgi:putative oxidoreductase
MKNFLNRVESWLVRLGWAAALATRVAIGWLFFQAGWGKLNNLGNTVEFFRSLGIPAPQLQAPFVALTELGCGALLLVGLYTRLAAWPLAATMIVALLTAKRDELHGLSSLNELTEFLYLLLLLWLGTVGGGRASVDGLRRRGGKS